MPIECAPIPQQINIISGEIESIFRFYRGNRGRGPVEIIIDLLDRSLDCEIRKYYSKKKKKSHFGGTHF